MKNYKDMGETGDSGGGYLVPVQHGAKPIEMLRPKTKSPRISVRGQAMPYTIRKEGSTYSVYHKGEDGQPKGPAVGTGHPSKEAAQGQIAAIYSATGGKSAKAQPDAKTYAGLLLQKADQIPVSVGDKDVDKVLAGVRSTLAAQIGTLRRIASGQSVSAANSVKMAERRFYFFATRLHDLGNRDQYHAVLTLAMLCSHLVQALNQGKSMNKIRKGVRTKARIKRYSMKLYGVPIEKMDLPTLQNEIRGLTSIRTAAKNMEASLRQAAAALSKANRMLPDDNLMGETLHEVALLLQLLGNAGVLDQYIARAKQALKLKQSQAQIPNDLGKLRQGGFTPEKPKRPGFSLFGR